MVESINNNPNLERLGAYLDKLDQASMFVGHVARQIEEHGAHLHESYSMAVRRYEEGVEKIDYFIRTHKLLVGCAASVAFALAGALGGATLRIFVPGVSIAAHAVALGLWAPSAKAAHCTDEKMKMTDKFLGHGPSTLKTASLVLSGYLLSVTATNMMGLSVNVVAPLIGVSALVPMTVVIAGATLPVFCLLGAGISKAAL